MENQDPRADVWRWLDCAIAEVAKVDYGRLTKDMSPSSQGQRVDRALAELYKLQEGEQPDYDDEWVALFYLTWYQPRQIFLAYSALRQVIRGQKPPSQIIDYGCGASAVQIALSILIAQWLRDESIRQGVPNPSHGIFAVHGIDPSEPMRRIGGVLWRQFQKEVKDTSPRITISDLSGVPYNKRPKNFKGSLLDIMDSMTDSCESHASYKDYAKSHAARHAAAPDGCWLTAMHAVYDESNQQDMKTVFSLIRKEQEPTLELVTFSVPDSDSKQRFFWTLDFKGMELSSVPALEENVLERTTKWRLGLWEKLEGEMKYFQQYLERDVEWDPQRVEKAVMIRRK